MTDANEEGATAPSGIDKAVALAGGQRQLGEQLGVTQQVICRWVKRGWVPVERVVEIEAQYGVPRRQLLKPSLVDLVTE